MNGFTIRQMRLIAEETFIWAHLRKGFGKSLIDQPVLRAKFASIFARCDANQAWLEHLTYQMTQMTYAEQQTHLAGPIALLKAHCTATATLIISDCVSIFGGRGVSKGGLGGAFYDLSLAVALFLFPSSGSSRSFLSLIFLILSTCVHALVRCD